MNAIPVQPFFIEQTQSETPYLYIGKVAAMTGASPKAIRLYEALKLIPPVRRKGRYRIYSEHEVVLIHIVKTAQSVGFNLAELRELLAHKARHKTFPLALANALFDRKRLALRAEATALKERERRLVALQKEMNRTFG